MDECILKFLLGILTRAVNDVLFTECSELAMTQGPGSLQSTNGTECIASPTLTLYEYKIALNDCSIDM